MSVRFILGRPGTGKTTACMEEVRSQIRENPSGTPLIYLVPEHMTFSTEYAFARTPGFEGITRLNVYSIPRLALRVLQQSGGATRIHLDGTGTAMLLRRIAEQCRSEFRLFRKAADQTGFYDLLGDTLSEFKRYCLTPEAIAEQSDELRNEKPEDTLLRDKLHDLALVYRSFEHALAGKYLAGDDDLKLMIEKIPETDFLRRAEIWVDGFQTMTPEEQLVIEKLMETADRMTVILGTDRAYTRPPDELSPFRHPALLYIQLRELAEERNVTIESVKVMDQVLRARNEVLKHLNLSFSLYPLSTSAGTEGLTLTEAVNKREEVEQAARNIIGLVRDRAYRFRDTTVLVRNLDNYADMIETVFGDYGIPVFIDRKRPMRHHPLIELIRSALETVQQNWRYEPVFRCVKTDLLNPPGIEAAEAREAMDELENVVMACGIYGRKKWTEEERWNYRTYRGLEEDQGQPTKEEREISQRIDRWRRIVAEPLDAFERDLTLHTSVHGRCEAIYRFLTDLSVPEKLEQMAYLAEKNERLSEAKEHGQVWKAVMDLLDQCVEGAGQESLSLDLFSKVIDSGLDKLEFALVPPALDQVLVGSMDRMRSTRLKAVFLLGVNEGVIPAKPAERGLFSDEDRDLLEGRGVHVADGEQGQMAGENELCFRALTLPEERLYVSYPLAAEDGEVLKPSPLIGRLRRLFPKLQVRLAPSEPRSLSEEEQIDFINAPGKTAGYLATQIREWQKGYPISDMWWDAYNWYTAQPEWGPVARRIMSGLFSRNEASLNGEIARDLYGDTIQASVSRMEMFNACPFSQFASYGLKLRERNVFQLTAPDIGQLFHLAIKKMTETLMHRRVNWSELSPEACDRLAADTVQTLAPGLQRQILSSTNRYRYLQVKLEKIVARVARVMRRHAQVSGFTPISLELPFGPGKPVPPLTFTLANGCKMEIVGRIDRVDKAEDHDRVLLRIIDYKSGAKDLNLDEVYYGLTLQMLAYLDVVITYSRRWLGLQADPAGVLYFHVHDPELSLDEKLSQEALEEELYKRFKMKGLLLEDEAALRLTDRHALAGRSAVAPFGMKKDGGLYRGSSVAGSSQFGALREYTRDVMETVGEKITDGQIDIAPYQLKGRMPCTYCPYRSVCRFDRSQSGNNIRALKHISDEQAWQAIMEKEGHVRDEKQT